MRRGAIWEGGGRRGQQEGGSFPAGRRRKLTGQKIGITVSCVHVIGFLEAT